MRTNNHRGESFPDREKFNRGAPRGEGDIGDATSAQMVLTQPSIMPLRASGTCSWGRNTCTGRLFSSRSLLCLACGGGGGVRVSPHNRRRDFATASATPAREATKERMKSAHRWVEIRMRIHGHVPPPTHTPAERDTRGREKRKERRRKGMRAHRGDSGTGTEKKKKEGLQNVPSLPGRL